MANEVIPDKYRDEDANERRKKSRRRYKVGGRRGTDNTWISRLPWKTEQRIREREAKGITINKRELL